MLKAQLEQKNRELLQRVEDLKEQSNKWRLRVGQFERAISGMQDDVNGADKVASARTRSLARVRESIETIVAMEFPMSSLDYNPQEHMACVDDVERAKIVEMVSREPKMLALLRHLHRLAH